MPGTPRPVIDPRFGTWTPIIDSIKNQQQKASGLASGSQNENVTDEYGNTTGILGQLNQIITIGATFGQAGVQIATFLGWRGQVASGDSRSHPTAGIAGVGIQGWGTMTLTAGSTTATNVAIDSPGGTLSVPPAYIIGAADVSDPSSGVATPAIPYYTTIQGITGPISGLYTFTLSNPAAESGTGLYWTCCTVDLFT